MTTDVMNYGNKMHSVSWCLVFWDVIFHCLGISWGNWVTWHKW